MRKATCAIVALFLSASPLVAASIVNYTVELGPYNPAYVTAWKAGEANHIFFTGGSPNDDQQFAVGDVITWDVVVALDPDGAHVQPGHPSDGKKPYGLANIVFNLELTDASDVPLSTGALFSAINDGTAGDPIAASAFAATLNSRYGTGAPRGPGRLIDQVGGTTAGHGGAHMDLFTYPTSEPTKRSLLGQGAGYVEWKRESATAATLTVPGVGLATLPDAAQSPGLGVVPLFEGQIDTSTMAPGTYKLKVIPGSGVNVLRGDYTDFLTKDKDAFAVAANQQNGDTITFTLVPPVVGCNVAPILASAASVRNHGAAGALGIPLALAGNPSVESRTGGPQQILLTYDQAIKAADGAMDSEVAVVGGLLNGPPVVDGSTLTVNLTNVQDASCVVLTISGITCAEGGAVADPVTLKLIARAGDVNGNGAVNGTDVNILKTLVGPAFPPESARYDVNLSGGINGTDVNIVKTLLSGVTTPACP